MTDLETARERLRAAEADAAEAQRVWENNRTASRVAALLEETSMDALLKARMRWRDARDAVVKLERK